MLIKKKPKEAVQFDWYLGIDPSANGTGLSAVIPVGPVKWGFKDVRRLTNDDELRGLRRVINVSSRVKTFVDTMGCLPKMALIEGYGYANKHSLGTLVEVGTGIRLMLVGIGVDLRVVSPNGLKMFITGNGNAGYNEVVLQAYKRFGIEDKSDDLIDAKCLSLMAMFMAEGWPLPLAQQLKAMDGIKLVMDSEENEHG